MGSIDRTDSPGGAVAGAAPAGAAWVTRHLWHQLAAWHTHEAVRDCQEPAFVGIVYYEHIKSSWLYSNLPRPMLECICSLPVTWPSLLSQTGCSDAPVLHKVRLLLRLQPSGLCFPHRVTASCHRCTWAECQFSTLWPLAEC